MRHVRDHDHQFDRRLSELEAHSRKYPRLSLPALSQQHTDPEPNPAPRRHTTTDTEATAALAAAALASTSPSKQTPPSLEPALDAALELDPTPKNSSDAPAPLGLSSPPLSSGTTANQEDADADPLRTPTQKSFHRTDTLESPTAMQLSSPPATVSRNGGKRTIDMTDEHDELDDEDSKTEKATPSHKGDAVDGLLKLMNTSDKRRESDALSG
jgi:hypothetical protein